MIIVFTTGAILMMGLSLKIVYESFALNDSVNLKGGKMVGNDTLLKKRNTSCTCGTTEMK